jgi:hypothetical protein
MHQIIRALFLIYEEAQDNADQCANELDRLKSTLLRTEEEKKRLEEEVIQVSVLFLFILYTGIFYQYELLPSYKVIILIAGKGNVEKRSTESRK